MELSERLMAVARMVTRGNVACDTGCDHGYVSIYLVREKICPKAIAMDLRPGPLSRAGEHIAMYGFGDYIETRLSDGVDALQPKEADTLILAGMGGRLMESIITGGMSKISLMKELVLQPQSEIPMFRKFLRKKGFITCRENMIFEDGKFYPVMRVIPGSTGTQDVSPDRELEDRYGGILLRERHPVLEKYLYMEKENLEELRRRVESAGIRSEKNRRRAEEIRRELSLNEEALRLFQN